MTRRSAERFHVIYLTGAPAAGKSTLARSLRRRVQPLSLFDYGAALVGLLSRRLGQPVDYSRLRAESGTLVTPDDIAATDEALIKWVTRERRRSHVLIDTHAVTREQYGYRATPFSLEHVRRLRPTLIIALYTEPVVTLRRLRASPGGRLPVSAFGAAFHAGLQGAVALTYAIALGRTVHFLDGGRASAKILADLLILVTTPP